MSLMDSACHGSSLPFWSVAMTPSVSTEKGPSLVIKPPHPALMRAGVNKEPRTMEPSRPSPVSRKKSSTIAFKTLLALPLCSLLAMLKEGPKYDFEMLPLSAKPATVNLFLRAARKPRGAWFAPSRCASSSSRMYRTSFENPPCALTSPEVKSTRISSTRSGFASKFVKSV